jgi:hypothetical protein
MARTASVGIMLLMNRPISNSITPPRRFLLLPEEEAVVSGQGVRIRRYRLTSVGRSQGLDRKTSPRVPSSR